MMQRRMLGLAVLVCLAHFGVLHLRAQGEVRSPSPSKFLGEVRDGYYVNDHFGFQIKPPSEWQPVDEKDQQVAGAVAAELLKHEGTTYVPPNFNSVTLLNLRKSRIGERGNALFRIMVTKQPSGSVTPTMVAKASRDKLLENPLAITVGEMRELAVSGRKFASFEYTVKSPTERPINSRYFGTVERGYSIGFVFTFVLEKDGQLLKAVFDSLTFK